MLGAPSDEGLIQRGQRPRERGTGLLDIARSVFRNRRLVWEMSRRELSATHAGQAAGAVWLFVHPLMLFAIYAFLFTLVFQVRIGGQGPSDYLIYLFSGLAPWLLTQDVIARSAGTLLASRDIVKKVVFPPEVLVAKTVLSSLVVQQLLLAATVLYAIGTRGTVSPMLLLLPVVLLLHLALMWGLALLLAGLTPYFRDIPELVRVFVTVNIYLMPVMYLPAMAPAALRAVISLNPFSYLIWCYQDILYFGHFANPTAWVVLPVLAAVALISGSYVFARLRHYFGSLL